MDFKIVVEFAEFILTLGFIYLIFVKFINPYLETKNSIRNKQVKNNMNDLYSRLDPSIIEETVDAYITHYINQYILYNFIALKITYIKKEEIDKMIKNVTKNIMLDISELYIFYIKMIHSIENDEELLKFIHGKVMDISVESVSNFNKQLEA